MAQAYYPPVLTPTTATTVATSSPLTATVVMPHNQPFQANVTGVVEKVMSRDKEPLHCVVYCPGNNLRLETRYQYSLFLNTGDTIAGFGIVHNNQFMLQDRPFVELPMDKESILRGFMVALKIGYGPASQIYTHLIRISSDIIALLSDHAYRFRERDATVIDQLTLDYKGDILAFRAQLELLLKWWYTWRSKRRLYLLGLNDTVIEATNLTADVLYERLLKNPYTVAAVPIETAHSICKQIQRPNTAQEIMYGTILRSLYRRQKDQGWTCTPSWSLGKEFPDIRPHMFPVLEQEYDIVLDQTYNVIYLKEAYDTETWLTENFSRIIKGDPITYDTPLDVEIGKDPNGKPLIRQSAQYKRKNLSMDQQKAIQGALDHDIAVITGPAGSGKTTCLDEVIYNLDLRGIKHLDCSFTGKAVARMREVTHTREPCTIHVAIKESPMGMGRVKTGLPSIDNPSRELVDVSPEVILMDEACTTSGPLMMGIMRAYPMTKRWIFFCDPNQLKPIEYLSVIENLIEAEVMPHYRLRTNFRVKTADGQTDGIIQNTTAIINHDIEYPFSFVTSHSNFQIIEGGIQQVMDLLFFFHRENVPADKIVIITPFKDLLPELNVGFQAIYDLGGQFAVDTRGVKWQMGDRVMLTKNDYEINVFNGEQGKVIDVQPQGITVDFGPSGTHKFMLEPMQTKYRNTKYQSAKEDDNNDAFDERTVLRLAHAYALSVDKSQGSEWPYVIYFIPRFTGSNFINRNRNYTAMTRAQNACYNVVPSLSQLEQTVVVKPNQRPARFKERLIAALPHITPFEIKFAWEQVTEDTGEDEIPDWCYER